MFRNPLFLFLCIFLCQNALFCATTANNPIKIGVLAPLSGLGDWWGKPYRDSIILAYEELGLTPDKVKLVIEDTRTDWPTLALATQKLINIDHVDAILNTFDKAGYVCAPILKPHHIPQLVLSLDDRSADAQTTFTIWTPIRHTTQMLLQEAVRTGHKKLALFVLRDYYPFRAELEIKKQLKDFPELSIAHTEYFNPDERDFRTLSLKAREEKWDLAVILAYAPTVNILTKQLLQDGVKNMTSIESFDQLQEDIKLLPSGTWWTGAAEHRAAFTAAFEDRFGYKPFVGPCYGYDELKLIMKAFGLDREHPEKALPGLSIVGAGGTTTITPKGWSDMPAYLKTWDGQGKAILKEWKP